MGIPHTAIRLTKERYITLVASLVLLIIIPPFLEGNVIINSAISLLFSLILFNCMLISVENRKIGFLHIVFIIAIALPWLRFADPRLLATAYIFMMLALSITAITIVKQLIVITNVSEKELIAALCGYMLVGLASSFVCAAANSIDPQSYNIPATEDGIYGFVYYSFVTLTSLGYGDITPQTPETRAIAILIAISGQFYLTILVAILIGKYLQKFGGNS